MQKPKEVSASIYDNGQGEVVVWNVSFRLRGSIRRKDGKVDPNLDRKLRAQIEQLVSQIEVSELPET